MSSWNKKDRVKRVRAVELCNQALSYTYCVKLRFWTQEYCVTVYHWLFGKCPWACCTRLHVHGNMRYLFFFFFFLILLEFEQESSANENR